jgi:hypothetical protein
MGRGDVASEGIGPEVIDIAGWCWLAVAAGRLQVVLVSHPRYQGAAQAPGRSRPMTVTRMRPDAAEIKNDELSRLRARRLQLMGRALVAAVLMSTFAVLPRSCIVIQASAALPESASASSTPLML